MTGPLILFLSALVNLAFAVALHLVVDRLLSPRSRKARAVKVMTAVTVVISGVLLTLLFIQIFS
ncbi:hypothetical protein E1091_01550 [Micromonospora fluostatini]|uniref:Uncharacterized protein n=1 Tax=Micromonospora fluostatini TaxID=1629071 RepID=A0ABY2DLH5_9ACTN|nr:hypothetical protein E1091_01550 [Micromonospora fluostatini]